MPGIPTRFSETPGAVGRPGPELGEDSVSVLSEAGLADDAIAELLASGAVRGQAG